MAENATICTEFTVVKTVNCHISYCKIGKNWQKTLKKLDKLVKFVKSVKVCRKSVLAKSASEIGRVGES
jgi:hypothetical protein